MAPAIMGDREPHIFTGDDLLVLGAVVVAPYDAKCGYNRAPIKTKMVVVIRRTA